MIAEPDHEFPSTMTLTETIHNALETGGEASKHTIPGKYVMKERMNEWIERKKKKRKKKL